MTESQTNDKLICFLIQLLELVQVFQWIQIKFQIYLNPLIYQKKYRLIINQKLCKSFPNLKFGLVLFGPNKMMVPSLSNILNASTISSSVAFSLI